MVEDVDRVVMPSTKRREDSHSPVNHPLQQKSIKNVVQEHFADIILTLTKARLAPFKFHSYELIKIVETKDLLTLKKKGTDGLLRGLLTDIERGITTQEGLVKEFTDAGDTVESVAQVIASLAKRRRIYGRNRNWKGSARVFAQLLGITCQYMYEVMAPFTWFSLSLVILALLDDYSLRSAADRTRKWAVGLAVFAISFVKIFLEVLLEWQVVLQFQELLKGPRVEVVRDGVKQKIYKKDVVVGDIVFFTAGGIVPFDGIFLSGYGVTCAKQYEATSQMEKGTVEYLISMLPAFDTGDERVDCFMHSGERVLAGSGRYVVTATTKVREDVSLLFDSYDRPGWLGQEFVSQRSLEVAGAIATPILFFGFVIKFLLRLHEQRTGHQQASVIIDFLIFFVSFLMIACLLQPLASPISTQLFLMKHLITSKIFVQRPQAFEFMAEVTDFCMDMTGTITEDGMTVISGLVGIHTTFQRDGQATGHLPIKAQHVLEHSVDLQALNRCLSPLVQRMFHEIITLTSVAIQESDPNTGDTVFLGNATEVALLQFSKELGWPDFQSTKSSAQILEMIPFSSSRMASGAFVDLGEGRCRLYLKGASEVLAKRCTFYILVNGDAEAEVQTSPMDCSAQNIINQTITFCAEQGLRTISLCYRDFDSWPPNGQSRNQHDDIEYEDFAHDMIFVGMVCIYHPIRHGVREAVEELQRTGVTVRICTGDHPLTAMSIAKQCGIPASSGSVIKGSTFTQRERRLGQSNKIDIQVLARSSPEDKAYFVSVLRSQARVVAFLGDGMNDRLAMKSADISMAVAGTDTANISASDIVFPTQDFECIINSLKWGKWLKKSRAQFNDIYIPTSVTIIFLAFVSAFASSTWEQALSLGQIVWIRLLIDPLIVLALSTDQPWLNDAGPRISSPSVYYLVSEALIVLFLFIFGHKFPGHPSTETVVEVSDRTMTLIFNTLFFMQIFSTPFIYWKGNGRRLPTIHWLFPAILIISVAIHLSIVLKGGRVFHVAPMSGVEWGCSMALSVFSVPFAILLKRVRNIGQAPRAPLKLG